MGPSKRKPRPHYLQMKWVPPHGHAEDPCGRCGQIHHRAEDGKYRPCFT